MMTKLPTEEELHNDLCAIHPALGEWCGSLIADGLSVKEILAAMKRMVDIVSKDRE